MVWLPQVGRGVPVVGGGCLVGSAAGSSILAGGSGKTAASFRGGVGYISHSPFTPHGKLTAYPAHFQANFLQNHVGAFFPRESPKFL